MTMGQLITELYDKYERRFGDEELAAVATEVTLEELLFQRAESNDDFADEEVTMPYRFVQGLARAAPR